MPDLLSHVLFGYAAIRVASVWFPTRRTWTSAFLVGSVLPDVSKIGLFFDDDPIEVLVGGPVNFLGWHTISGITLWALLIALIVDEQHRRTSVTLVVLGALGHLFLDMMVRTASGLATYAVFWPLSDYRPKTPGLYLSGDPEVLLVAAATTALALLVSKEIR